MAVRLNGSGEIDAVEGIALAVRKVGSKYRQLATSGLDNKIHEKLLVSDTTRERI